jgi:hypothetical protein
MNLGAKWVLLMKKQKSKIPCKCTFKVILELATGGNDLLVRDVP